MLGLSLYEHSSCIAPNSGEGVVLDEALGIVAHMEVGQDTAPLCLV